LAKEEKRGQEKRELACWEIVAVLLEKRKKRERE